jgi:hypothetical protein
MISLMMGMLSSSIGGLHVYDPEDARGLASYSFMETVESNMALFTKRQIIVQIGFTTSKQAWRSCPTQTYSGPCYQI